MFLKLGGREEFRLPALPPGPPLSPHLASFFPEAGLAEIQLPVLRLSLGTG